MEFNNIGSLNTYELIKKYLSRENLSSHITKHLSTATLKPIDDIFSSKINDSFVILKFQENQNRSNYFKYLPSSEELSISNYDRIEASSSTKNIIGIDYNNNSLYFILNIGNTFSIVTPNNIINYESLTLKEAQKLNNEIGKKYIIKITCGENHCLFLTHAGMVYTIGDNTYGQLGIGQNNITKETKEGLMLKELLNYRISDISAGKNHSFCFGVVREMTKAGYSMPSNNTEFDPKVSYFLFGWGDNSCFQIGMKQINRNKLILKPTKIYCTTNFHNPAIVGEELINICCGLNFSALLFKNGKLLTFGDNQYNQLIYKENEFLPNFVNNYLPKKIGKIIKIITAGNSLLLISEFNKIIIFGKFNEPNKDEIKIIDLVDNYESYKYIFNDKILKVIFFNNEEISKNIFGEIKTAKIEDFLVNTKLQKNVEQTIIKDKEITNITKNNKDNIINNNKTNNNNISNRTNNSNIKVNNNLNTSPKAHTNNNSNNSTNEATYKKAVSDKIVYETVINNKIVEATPNNNKNTKIKNDLNNSNNNIPNSAINNTNKYSDFKNVKRVQNTQRIKYKNSITIKSSTSNDNVKKFNIYQTKNSKIKIEPRKEFNGAEERKKSIKNTKIKENNGNTSQIHNKTENDKIGDKSNNKKINTSSLNNINIENNTINKYESSEKLKNLDNNIAINGNENENGNSNQNIAINKSEIKTILNKNILKNKPQKNTTQIRYEEEFHSNNENKEKEKKNETIDSKLENKLNVENKNIDINQPEIKTFIIGEEENIKNNGGIFKNGQNIEEVHEHKILKENINIELKSNIQANNNQINNFSNLSLSKENNSIKNIKSNISNNLENIQHKDEILNINSYKPTNEIKEQKNFPIKKQIDNNLNYNKFINSNNNNLYINDYNNKSDFTKKENFQKIIINKDNNINNNKKDDKNNSNIPKNINSDKNDNINNILMNNNINKINNKKYNIDTLNSKINNNTYNNNININNAINNKMNNNINNNINNNMSKGINNSMSNNLDNDINININNNINKKITNNMNNNIKNNANNNIKSKLNQTNENNNQFKQNKGTNYSNNRYNISISKKDENDEENYDIFQSINKNEKAKVNNNINNANINKKSDFIDLKINNINKTKFNLNENLSNQNDRKKLNNYQFQKNNLEKLLPLNSNQEINNKKNENNQPNIKYREQENKENTNIFRELSQFVSTAVNKIKKNSQNRTDAKKDAFFEQLITNNNPSFFRIINPKLLINNIISGVPNRYRGRFWLKCIGNQLSITPDYFDINLSKYYEKNEDTKDIKYKLPFPNLGIFKENTPLTSDLVEVINGFVISRPDIEYSEKISYLVGMLIINMDKYQAYVSFMNLILNPNIIIYYLNSDKDENVMEYGYSETPGRDDNNNSSNMDNSNKGKKIPSIVEKNLRRVIFKQLLFHNLPDLCSHLELLNILPEDYFDEWNETIFCKNFNIDISMKIWDLFVVQGEKIIFDAGIALMKELQDELLDCEEKEEILDILLNSQMREINEANVLKEIQKVEYPDWIQSEVENMSEDTVIPINFNKS